MERGSAYGIRPAGMLALDVVRLEAGLILLEVDYTSARHAMNPEQNYSPVRDRPGPPGQLRQGATSSGRLALEREARAGGPARRLVGLQLDWYDIEGLYNAQGLPPAISPTVDRAPVPVFAGAARSGGRRATAGARSSSRRSPWRPWRRSSRPSGTKLSVEWTVEGRRGRVGAIVVELPFLDLPRKRA